MNICIVGLGGVGSALVGPLAKYLKHYQAPDKLEVTFVDGDKVEESNLARQEFITADIDAPKARVMSDYFSQIIGEKADVTTIAEYLSPTNIGDIIVDGMIVFCGVDNFVTRFLIEEHTKEFNDITVFYGGNEYDDGDVNVFRRVDGKSLTPLYSEKHPEIMTRDKYPFELSCADEAPSSPQLIFANETVAQLMLNGMYALGKNSLKWHQVFFDLTTQRIRHVE